METFMGFSASSQFDAQSFKTKAKFQNFVRKVLSLRCDKPIFGGKFSFRYCCRWVVDWNLINKITSYIMSYRIQHLRMEVNTFGFPESLLNCKSFETLDLRSFGSLPESYAFSMLNSLHLSDCYFGGSDPIDFPDPFANCPNLKTLSVSQFNLKNRKCFRIPGLQLLSLSLENGYCWGCKIEICAPKLTSLRYHWIGGPMDFGELNLPSLSVLDIRVCVLVFGPSGQPLRIVEKVNDNMNLINMFQGFQNVQFVKLHSDTIKILTLVPGLLEKQPSPFTNMKSLKLYSGYNSKLPRIPFHVMHYLLGDSASDDFEIVQT